MILFSFNRAGVVRAAAVTVGLALLAATSPAAMAKNKHVEEVIAAGIVGVAVGAALSHKHQHNSQIYHPGYQPYYPAGGYDTYYEQSFRPSSDTTCYTAQRVCYNDNGSVANKWTRRVFDN